MCFWSVRQWFYCNSYFVFVAPNVCWDILFIPSFVTYSFRHKRKTGCLDYSALLFMRVSIICPSGDMC